MEGSVDELINSTGNTLHALKEKMPAPAGAYHLVYCGGRRMGIGMLSSVAPLFVCIAFQGVSHFIMGFVSVLLLLISAVLYRKLWHDQLYEI